MAASQKPVLRQQIFEARYEKGYRYLDRCGETMIILENELAEVTKHIWLPQEMSPTGARLQCPDLDITIFFNARLLVIDQNPVGKDECDFPQLADLTLATIVGKLVDRDKMQRFGARRVEVIPEDSIEAAQKLSLLFSPLQDVRSNEETRFEPREVEFASRFETDDCGAGIRIAVKPYMKIWADVQIDERLKLPAHHLPTGQREALLEQQRRAKKRQEAPEAGLAIDIDYYWLWPEKGWSVPTFLREAGQAADRYRDSFIAMRRR